MELALFRPHNAERSQIFNYSSTIDDLKTKYKSGEIDMIGMYEPLRRITKGIWRLLGGKFAPGLTENKDKIKELVLLLVEGIIKTIKKKKARKGKRVTFIERATVIILCIYIAYSLASRKKNIGAIPTALASGNRSIVIIS